MSLSLSNLTNRLFRRLNELSTTRARTTNRFRPTLEALDVRVVPAVYYWSGAVSTDATDAHNWLSAGRVAGALPDSDDDVYIDGSAWTDGSGHSRDCSGLISGDGSHEFLSLHILGGYNGTVTLGEGITVGVYEQTAAALSQPTAGTDLTVEQSFVWTGGTLNSSSHLANVTITGSGATALVEPTNGGTVNLGSNFNLSSGAVATLKEGIINFTNGGSAINVNENCRMFVAPPATSAVGVHGGVFLIIKQGAWFEVTSGDYNQNGEAFIEGGSLVLKAGTSAKFELAHTSITKSFFQTAGATYIAADATLNVGARFGNIGGMLMSGGLLSIKAGTQPQNFAGHIVGDPTITGGDIRFESLIGGDNHDFGKFIVDGKVNWSGGTYHPYVSSEDEGISDVWQVTGAFVISGSAAVVVTAVDGENNVVTPDSNMEWFLFTSDTSITAANNTPSLTSGYSFVIDQDNPAKWWKVKKN